MTRSQKNYSLEPLEKYLRSKPTAENKELYSLCNATTASQKGSVRKTKSRLLEVIERGETSETQIKKIPKSTQKPAIHSPPQEITAFIDDPNELLMSVAIRELNKPDPDPRWANILIACKKENITIRNEMLDQFKQLPTKALVSLLNKNLPNES